MSCVCHPGAPRLAEVPVPAVGTLVDGLEPGRGDAVVRLQVQPHLVAEAHDQVGDAGAGEPAGGKREASVRDRHLCPLPGAQALGHTSQTQASRHVSPLVTLVARLRNEMHFNKQASTISHRACAHLGGHLHVVRPSLKGSMATGNS